MDESLNWEASYAIAMALQTGHPAVDLQEVSLADVLTWTLALPAFDDDPELANEEVLLDIFRIWLEERLGSKLEGEI